MITGHVFIATSLDGFIARPDGDIAWLLERDDPAEDHGYDSFIRDIDAIVMGRGSYDAVRQVTPWPYRLPVLVMASDPGGSVAPLDAGAKPEFTDRAPAQVMALLAARGHRRAYVDGGLVVQSFLRAGLIADLVITRVPVLLGQGRSLFGPLGGDVALVHEGTRCFASGLVQSRYRVAA